MGNADYTVLAYSLAGIFAVGLGLSLRVEDTSDLFAAGERSPWRASGQSRFMTMFSAGTFVVWGGVAYRLGFRAAAIKLMDGVAALLTPFAWREPGGVRPAAARDDDCRRLTRPSPESPSGAAVGPPGR